MNGWRCHWLLCSHRCNTKLKKIEEELFYNLDYEENKFTTIPERLNYAQKVLVRSRVNELRVIVLIVLLAA